MIKTGSNTGRTHPNIGFIIAARPAVVLAQPAEGALDYPAPGQRPEALGAGWSLHYFPVRRQPWRQDASERLAADSQEIHAGF